MVAQLRQRAQLTCPFCGKTFMVQLDVSTYVTAEIVTPIKERRDIAAILRTHEAKVDFILRAMRALATKEASGMIEVEDITDIAEKVGLSREAVEEVLKAEKEAGKIYEPKPGVICFTAPPEKEKI